MRKLDDHLTDRFTVARLRLEARRALRPLVTIVLAGAVGVAAIAYMVAHVSRTLGRDTETISVIVRDATGVQPGSNEVRFKGIPVGTITDVEVRDGRPVVTAVVQRKYGAIYRDARVTLRPATPLQDMFLDIVDRGTSRAGRATTGSPVPSANVATPVNVADVLNTLDADARTRLQQLLNNLGNGVADRGAQLRAAFIAAVPFLRNAARITDELAARRARTRRLVHNTSLLAGELARRETVLRGLVANGSQAASALAAHRAAIDATVRELPGTVTALERGLDALGGAIPDVERAALALDPVVRRVPQALSDIDGLTAAATPALAALRPPVRRLVPTATQLRPLSHDLDAAVSEIRPQTDTVDLVTKRVVGCKRGLQHFFQWDTSLGKYGDSLGGILRGNLVLGAQSAGISNGFEYVRQSCTPGITIGPRPVTAREIGEE